VGGGWFGRENLSKVVAGSGVWWWLLEGESMSGRCRWFGWCRWFGQCRWFGRERLGSADGWGCASGSGAVVGGGWFGRENRIDGDDLGGNLSIEATRKVGAEGSTFLLRPTERWVQMVQTV
jgi:hypothetical protein